MTRQLGCQLVRVRQFGSWPTSLHGSASKGDSRQTRRLVECFDKVPGICTAPPRRCSGHGHLVSVCAACTRRVKWLEMKERSFFFWRSRCSSSHYCLTMPHLVPGELRPATHSLPTRLTGDGGGGGNGLGRGLGERVGKVLSSPKRQGQELVAGKIFREAEAENDRCPRGQM